MLHLSGFRKQFFFWPLPDDPLCLAGQPGVTADESEMSPPLVHVTRGHGPEVQPLPVTRSPIAHLRWGHLQQQLVQALGFRLFILAKLCGVYLVPQNAASTMVEGIER